MIECVIIEDEPLARKLLEDYISKISFLSLLQSFSDPLKGLQFLQEHPVDLLFLDVQMPDLTGMGVLKILTQKPFVILTTAYSEYALDGYELDVTDYLLKPIVFERFVQAVDRVKSRKENQSPAVIKVSDNNSSEEDIMYVKDGTKLVRININEILYIEGLKDYVSIYTPGQKIVSLQRMKNLESQLPKNKFIRIHHSYIIATKWLQAIHKDFVEINKVSIPIGETYRKFFREYVDKQKLLGETARNDE
ncbi:MAG: LytTR family DNA-binding domain-containing protein [Saprospiraceae bacterium]